MNAHAHAVPHDISIADFLTKNCLVVSHVPDSISGIIKNGVTVRINNSVIERAEADREECRRRALQKSIAEAIVQHVFCHEAAALAKEFGVKNELKDIEEVVSDLHGDREDIVKAFETIGVDLPEIEGELTLRMMGEPLCQ